MTVGQISEAWDLLAQNQDLDAATAFLHVLRQAPSAEDRHQAEFGLGYALAFLGEFDEARGCFTLLRAQAAAQGDLSAEHRALHQVGMVERMAGNWEAAHACFAEEEGLIVQLGSPDLEVAVNAYEQDLVALKRGFTATSRSWFERSLRHAQRTQDLVAVGCAFRGLGDWHQAQGLLGEALSQWEAAHQAFLEAGETKASEEIRVRMLAVEPRSSL